MHTLPMVSPSYIASPSSLKSNIPEKIVSVPEAKQYSPPNTVTNENSQMNRIVLSKLMSTSYLDNEIPIEK